MSLEEAFHGKAILDRDTAAGALLVKINERRATLLGLNPVTGHAVQRACGRAKHDGRDQGLHRPHPRDRAAQTVR
jgi:hypothetical protein